MRHCKKTHTRSVWTPIERQLLSCFASFFFSTINWNQFSLVPYVTWHTVFVHYLLIDLVAINKIVLIVCFCVRVCLLVRLFAFFVFYSKQTQHAELRGPLMLFWYNYISVIIYIKFMLIYALWVIELYRCDGAPRFAPLFFSFGCRSLFYFLHISFVFVH